MRWIIILIIIVAIQFAVRGFSLLIERHKYKEYQKNSEKDIIKIKHPKFMLVLGVIGIFFSILPYLLTYFFPNVFHNLTLFPIIVFGIASLMGLYLIIATMAEEITLIKSEDYYLERNVFGKTKKIYYKDIEDYRIYKNHYLIIRIKKPNGKVKREIIDMSSLINIRCFIVFLSQKRVKRRDKNSFTAKE